jgi:hydroxypyruvate isomerase
MARFAANLSMMYTEFPFLERFAAASRDGFKAVEYLFPFDYTASDLADLLIENGLSQVLFNALPGDWLAGERGLACLPGRESEFREGIRRALEYAHCLSCPRVHVMAGVVLPGLDFDGARATYISNLAWATEQAEAAGKEILIEPINPRDMPGYFLNRQDDAHAIVAEIGSPNLKVQLDLYHCQIVEGDLAMKLKRYLKGPEDCKVGHIQIASVPERHEPDSGELNYDYLLDLIDMLGFDGWIGCEYRPRAGTSEGLGWLRRRLSSS